MSQSESASESRLSDLYDNLSRYSYLLNRIKGRDFLKMHKILQIPEESQHLYNERDRTHYLDDLVLIEADLPENPMVLDAGCGFGGTIFRWYSQKPGIYHGFTLSKYQQKIATGEAQRLGISQSCQFYLKSYSEPTDIKYHAVVAIESLIHSQDLAAVIGNFTRSLLPKGKLVIVDDMALDEGIRQTKEFELLRDYWFLSDLPSGSYYTTLLKRSNLKILSRLDLTPQLYFPSEQSLEKRMKRAAALIRITPIGSMRTFLRTHLGGFALQKLYHNGKMKYQLIVAEKQG